MTTRALMIGLVFVLGCTDPTSTGTAASAVGSGFDAGTGSGSDGGSGSGSDGGSGSGSDAGSGSGDTCDYVPDFGATPDTAKPSAVEILASTRVPSASPEFGAGAGSAPRRPDCICDECRRCNSIQKLCQVPHGPDNLCNPGIPGGTPPDWRWLVNLGRFPNCAAISANGGTSSGYSYYGGTANCVLHGCRPY